MRPTYLQLRSPKERTEYTVHPVVSHNGSKLFHQTFVRDHIEGSPVKEQKTYAFAPSNRFFYYKRQEERIPPHLGPGSHNPHESFKFFTKSPCSVKVMKLDKQSQESALGQTFYLEGGGIIKDTHANKLYGRPIQTARQPMLYSNHRKQRRNIHTGGQYSSSQSMNFTGSDLHSGRYLESPNDVEPERPPMTPPAYANRTNSIKSPYQNVLKIQSQSNFLAQSAQRPFSKDAARNTMTEAPTSPNRLDLKFSMPANSTFSKKLLQNLKYAQTWGQRVNQPTFNHSYFSNVSSPQSQTIKASKQYQSATFDTSPWPQSMPQQILSQTGVSNLASLSGLPPTSYIHKRSEINNPGKRVFGANQGYNSAEDETNVNYDPNMQILERKYGDRKSIAAQLHPFGKFSDSMKVSQKEYVYSEDGEGETHQYEEDNRLNEMQFEINTGAQTAKAGAKRRSKKKGQPGNTGVSSNGNMTYYTTQMETQGSNGDSMPQYPSGSEFFSKKSLGFQQPKAQPVTPPTSGAQQQTFYSQNNQGDSPQKSTK